MKSNEKACLACSCSRFTIDHHSAFTQLEEVIVTALSETTLQEAGGDNIEDVAQLVHSIAATVNLNPFAAGVRIRGVGQHSKRLSGLPSVRELA